MKVTLAYPYDGKAPDETIEVDDQVGRQLIGTGWARPANTAPESAGTNAGDESTDDTSDGDDPPED